MKKIFASFSSFLYISCFLSEKKVEVSSKDVPRGEVEKALNNRSNKKKEE